MEAPIQELPPVPMIAGFLKCANRHSIGGVPTLFRDVVLPDFRHTTTTSCKSPRTQPQTERPSP
jgi:hypothetical protein